MRTISRTLGIVAGCALFTSLALAQGRGPAGWNTAGADAQRSSWARTDDRISAASMPGFQFLWKVKVDNEARQSYALSSAVMLDRYIGYRGFRSYAFFGGASNNAIAIDTDLGRMEWTQNFGPVAAGGTAACPGAMTAGIARATPLFQAAAGPGRGGGGGGIQAGAASGVGEPEQGAVTIKPARGPAGGRGGSGGGRGAVAASGPPRPSRPIEMIDVLSIDGMLRTLYVSNGTNAKPPLRFLPANANAGGLLLVDNVIYASTSGNCGGVPNGVWAMDLAAPEPKPMHWSSNGGSIAGTEGPALGTDATVYAATSDGEYSPAAYSDSVIALDAKTLRLKDFFTPGKSEFTSSPVVFSYEVGDKEKDLIAVANKDGRLYLLDSAELGGADHKTPLASVSYANSGANAGALVSWQDSVRNRWILVGVDGALNVGTHFPATNGAVTAGAIAAFKVVDQSGVPTLQPAWVSRDIASPAPPIVIDGIVFAVAGGAGSKPGVLYALNGQTGKELFNSGSTITTPIPRSGGLAGSGGQLYVSGADSTVYAFGIPLVAPALARKVQ